MTANWKRNVLKFPVIRVGKAQCCRCLITVFLPHPARGQPPAHQCRYSPRGDGRQISAAACRVPQVFTSIVTHAQVLAFLPATAATRKAVLPCVWWRWDRGPCETSPAVCFRANKVPDFWLVFFYLLLFVLWYDLPFLFLSAWLCYSHFLNFWVSLFFSIPSFGTFMRVCS